MLNAAQVAACNSSHETLFANIAGASMAASNTMIQCSHGIIDFWLDHVLGFRVLGISTPRLLYPILRATEQIHAG